MRDSLEVSLVAEAEMVFTTLSSTGRKVFERGTCGRFHTVLIDEAAQSSEIAALQPLTFGCKRWEPCPVPHRPTPLAGTQAALLCCGSVSFSSPAFFHHPHLDTSTTAPSCAAEASQTPC